MADIQQPANPVAVTIFKKILNSVIHRTSQSTNLIQFGLWVGWADIVHKAEQAYIGMVCL
jgi:hypothetical protein